MRDMAIIRYSLFVVIVLVASTRTDAQAPDADSLAGCATDVMGQPVPGITIDVSIGSVHRLTTSDARGCYEVTDLPRGSYALFARLPGFLSVARDEIAIAPGRRERIDIQMRVHAICECVGPSTLASLWHNADGVVQLRITGHGPGPTVAAPGESGYIKHTAAVVSVLKAHAHATVGSTTLAFLQTTKPYYSEQEPYAIGQEFVVFLQWSAAHASFVRLEAPPRAAGAFALENGKVRSAGIDGYAGKSVVELLAELRTLARQ